METKPQPDLKDRINGVLRTCYDPEIPVNIYELGLIYDVHVDEQSNAYVKMTLTSPACPVAGTLPGEVEDKIRKLPDVKEVRVDVVWEPPWNPDMMSDIARYELGMM
jgi:FeS assembly SUF system protein